MAKRTSKRSAKVGRRGDEAAAKRVAAKEALLADGNPQTSTKYGRIAFITTPRFRKQSPHVIADFVYRHLYQVCDPFEVMTTGGTMEFVKQIVASKPDASALTQISESMGIGQAGPADLKRWREVIDNSMVAAAGGFQGMIHIAFELVEQRLDAVIHFTDWEDKSAKPDSAVLAREANVHDVPIAHDPDTARAYISTWRRHLITAKQAPVFKRRVQPSPQPLVGITVQDEVLAMVAHDNTKLEICRFAVENAAHILKYDFVLATGTTGGLVRGFLAAAGRGSRDIDRIRVCNSGPKGGDVQIAYAVVRGICKKIIFLQDPFVSHPHDPDIRLFEQAALAPGVHVELATNVESARLLIGT